jgi:hypothetical protein
MLAVNIDPFFIVHLENWTHSWVSSQLPPSGAPLRLRVRRLGGAPIAAAAVHPLSSGVNVATVAAGVAELAAPRAARAAIDFDGAMDAHDTGPSYAGPPVHAFAWFVDDAPADLPDPAAPATRVVRPGDAWPAPAELAAAAWPTVVFAPGVHRAAPPWVTDAPRAWAVYNLSAHARYYLCPGAVVHAAFHGGAGAWAQNGLAVDGPGVLSGEEMLRVDDPDNESPSGIVFSGVRNSSVRGVTLIDFPNHHLILGQAAGDELSNVKVLGWRTNGDGVHVFDSWRVRDLFLRTQDDALYISCGDGCAGTFDRITTWNDANGVAFLFSAGAGVAMSGTVLRDSDAIYTRTSWYWWGPNTVFVNRGPAIAGRAMSGAIIENVRVEDRNPAFNPFRIEVLEPYAGAAFCNISFSNISVANFSTIREDPLVHPALPLPHGIPNTIFAVAPARIYNVAFNNVTIAGVPMRELVRDKTIFNISAGLINVTVNGVDIYAAAAMAAD